MALLGTTLKATYLIRQAVRRLKKGCETETCCAAAPTTQQQPRRFTDGSEESVPL
ncbi:hypothetical protein [Geomonas terrae]|uniref:hypothetical protein n=1 Tax=Geomonas terrae TaxID=2562681 RepID=UPI0013A5C685|nr:hypothetical protein [Geomonas terrae]